MKTILHLQSSLFSNGGQSSQLSGAFVSARKAAGATVIARDLATDPIPHLSAERFAAFLSKPESRTALQAAVLAQSDALIEELRRADEIVIGLPMYNFGIPSTLKAYFDHVARAGQTFKYTAEGPVGLLTGKKAYVFAARGGYYAGTAADTQTQYVRDFLAFLGITDVEFVYAEGLAINGKLRDESLARARARVEELNEMEAA